MVIIKGGVSLGNKYEKQKIYLYYEENSRTLKKLLNIVESL